MVEFKNSTELEFSDISSEEWRMYIYESGKTRNIGNNYGWIFTAYGIAGILGPVAGGVLFDATQRYMIAFVFAGILCFLAAGCSMGVWGFAKAQARDLKFKEVLQKFEK